MDIGALKLIVLYNGITTKDKIKRYQLATRSLMYAITQTQPNLSFIVLTLSQFNNNPSLTYQKVCQRALTYLSLIIKLKLTLIKLKAKDLNYYRYLNSDYTKDV